jgi:signal transduction histidine kinase
VLQAIPAANAGWVALWDGREHSLIPQVAAGYPDNESMIGIRYQAGNAANQPDQASLPYQVYQQGLARRVDVRFAQDYNIPAAELLLYRHGTGGRLPVSALLVPLRRGELSLGVLVLDNFNASDVFSADDETLAYSLGQQSALALESARLYMAAEQRASQLAALNQVAGAITSSLQRSQLISSLLEMLKAVLPFNTATLWLRKDQILEVAAASGFSDDESRLAISVGVQDSRLFQQMVAEAIPLNVADTRQDDRFLQLEEPEFLSWIGIPLLVKSELVGVIALEKREPDFYTPEHIRAATTFASQAAVALENARLFEESNHRAAELDERSQRLALLNRLSVDLGGTLDVDRILKITAQYLYSALGASQVACILNGDKNEPVVQVEIPSISPGLPLPLQQVTLLRTLFESQGIYTSADIQIDPEMEDFIRAYPLLMHCHGLAVVPLVTAARLMGWMLIAARTESRQEGEARFSIAELELSRTIANQAAVAVQTARLYLETRRLTEDLEKRVEERTLELRREHNNTETLLRIITELSNSLDFDQVLNRALFILNESIGAEQSIVYLPQNQRAYKVGEGLVRGGSQPVGALEKEISSWVIRKKAAALVNDLGTDGRWKIPTGETPPYRSLIVVPLVLGEEVMGTLLLLHRQASFFILEQVGMVEATARQFSIALNNAELFNLIRDQAQNLGNLLRDQQIEASRSRAILEAVADGVLVTDASTRITLFNVSAERILEIPAQKILKSPLEDYAGLFGKPSQHWLEIIRKWSHDPGSYQGETYAEQQELANGRVVAVTLAPVFFRSEFMATVSIFRDITREVQVDRLKSEFVANVSHELRTPMTSIKGYVEVMLMGVTGPISDQQEHFLKIIRNNTERLNVLVNDLLDVSRIESGRMQLEFQPVDLREVAQDVLAEFQRRSREEEKLIYFSVTVSPNLPRVKADSNRVRQVLASLVSNGFNYTPAEGHVTIKLGPTDDHSVQIDVVDDGIGLSPRDQSRLFERFYRGDDPLVLASAGTGLGLAISKILIEMHGGKIWYTSSGVRGEGCVFSFTLPCSEEEE